MKMNKMEELKKKYGIYYNEKGELVFNDFTSEEQARIEETFQNLKGKLLRPDIADEFQEMLTSIGLISLGDKYLMQAKFLLDYEESESRKKEIDENLEHAIIKYIKALSIYSIKTIFFSLAKALIMKNDFLTAQECLNNYLTHLQPEKYRNMVTNLFLQYHLQVLGYSSIQELDNEVSRLIKKPE